MCEMKLIVFKKHGEEVKITVLLLRDSVLDVLEKLRFRHEEINSV